MTTTLNDTNRQYSYNLDDGSEYSYDDPHHNDNNKHGGVGVNSVGGYDDDSSIGEGSSSSAYNLRDKDDNKGIDPNDQSSPSGMVLAGNSGSEKVNMNEFFHQTMNNGVSDGVVCFKLLVLGTLLLASLVIGNAAFVFTTGEVVEEYKDGVRRCFTEFVLKELSQSI